MGPASLGFVARAGGRAVHHAGTQIRHAGGGQRCASRAGIELVPTLETASLQSVKRTLASGGFSLMSPLAVESEERSGSLKSIPLRDVKLARELHAVHDCKVRLSGVAQRFWSWLSDHPASADAHKEKSR